MRNDKKWLAILSVLAAGSAFEDPSALMSPAPKGEKCESREVRTENHSRQLAPLRENGFHEGGD